MNVPLMTGLFQFLIHSHRTGLRCTAHRELHGHNGQTQHDQTDQVNQHESTAAIGTGQPREFPHVAAADGTTCTEQDKSEAGGKFFTLLHNLPHSKKR